MNVASELANCTERLTAAIYQGKLTRWQSQTVAQTIASLHRQRRVLRWALLAMTLVAIIGWMR